MQVTRSRRLDDGERCDWLRLARTPNVGAATFNALIDAYASAGAALDALPELARRGGSTSAPRIPARSDIQREIEAVARLGGRIIASCEPDFPPGLAALDGPLPAITMIGGRHELLARDMIAIVGARNASALGRKFAQMIAADLGQAGLVIASGLARGIDAAAHEASLATGTCAVVAGGIDIVYPPEHRSLYERIAAEGVVVSEMPLGLAPTARHFPRRNRIVSGLSRGIVVIEAAERSGSLITANYALEQGREIFAVPGSPLDPRSRGTNRLIREGATLTENATDVLEAIRPMLAGGFAEPEALSVPRPGLHADSGDLAPARAHILELLGPSAVAVDDLVRQSRLPAAQVLVILLELELAGIAGRETGNRFVRRQV